MDLVLGNIGFERARIAVHRFMRWWGSELLSLLPPRWQELARTRGDRLVVQLGDPELIVNLCTDDSQRELGRYGPGEREALNAALAGLPIRGTEVVLRLEAHAVLSRTLDLPLEAEENLREVLAFEMDRLTPFRAEDVYYDAEIIAKRPNARQLQVKLSVVPRETLDQALERLARLGLRPASVNAFEAGPGEAGTCADGSVNLLPPERRPRLRRPGTRLNLPLAVLAVLLLLAVVSLPLAQQRTLVANLKSLLEEAQQKAEAVELLHEELNSFAEESRFLIEQRRNAPRIVHVLAEITALLPDDTWVSALEISQGEITIQGESPSASILIGLIEASPSFHNASFGSPVIQDQRTGRERFQLSADIAVEPLP
jgi:general secretion pathway protein L